MTNWARPPRRAASTIMASLLAMTHPLPHAPLHVPALFVWFVAAITGGASPSPCVGKTLPRRRPTSMSVHVALRHVGIFIRTRIQWIEVGLVAGGWAWLSHRQTD